MHGAAPLPLPIVIRIRLVISRHSKLPACLAEVHLAHENTQMDEICVSGKLSVQEPSEWGGGGGVHTCEYFTVFQPKILTDSSSLGIRTRQVVLTIN